MAETTQPSAASPMSRFDSNHDGKISLDELYQTGPPALHPRMKQVFDTFDKDHLGSLGYDDTVKVIATVSGLLPKLSPEVDGALQPIPIEVNPQSKRALIKATVNGVIGRFLLDTGTSDTIFDGGFAKRAGVDFVEISMPIASGNYGKKGDLLSLVRVQDMEIAGTHFRNFHAVIRDDKRTYEFGGGLDGVMGANILFAKPITLDFRKQTLSFFVKPPEKPDFTFDLMAEHGKTAAVHAEVDGAQLVMMLDSGAAIGDAILVNEPYHAALRKLAAAPEAKTYRAKEVRVGGQVIATDMLCLLRPFEQTVIGSFFFARHIISVDTAAGKLWLERNH